MRFPTSELAVPVTENDHIRGRLDAPVTLVEYGDFECPFCGLAYPTVKAVERMYPDTLRVVYRQFPLPQHPHAMPAAETSEFAADFGRFWEMHDMLFEHQDALDVVHLLAYASRLGLDPDALAHALRVGTYRAIVLEQLEGGQESGVTGTPAFFLNGVRFDAEPTLETFSAAIDMLMTRVPP
jgi:protein-disulfide isomerase